MSDKILSKIRGLLSKAEDAAATPAEAETYSRKAEELIARYAIDTALIQQKTGRGKPVTRTYEAQAPYGKAKCALANGIALAHGCKVIMMRDKSFRIVGFEADLDMVDMLFTSLIVQGTNAVLNSAHGGKAFRASFWYSFAGRVSERLAERRKQTTEEAAPGTGLVLVDRAKEVDDAFAEAFPRTKSVTARVTSAAGVEAGRNAANRADMGGQRFGGARPAIA